MKTAREQGKTDHAEGRGRWENPYCAGSMDYFNWTYAWLEAELKEVKEVIDESHGKTDSL